MAGLGAQFVLELFDLVTQGGPGDIEQQRGFREVELLGQYSEVAQVPDLHGGQSWQTPASMNEITAVSALGSR